MGDFSPGVAGSASLLTALAAVITAIVLVARMRYQNRGDRANAESVSAQALDQAVRTIQEVYGKITGDLREQVDELIARVQAVEERERQCRAELAQTKADLHQLRTSAAGHTQDIENMRVQLAKEPEP